VPRTRWCPCGSSAPGPCRPRTSCRD
jgi:hypothetical protein